MKILTIDIETLPNLGVFFGTRNINIGIEQIIQPSRTVCFAAEWYGEKHSLEFYSEWNDGQLGMIKAAHRLMSEADAIIHYNGNSFDIPVLNGEFKLEKLRPPAPSKQIDLYRTVRKNFRFPSYKLDYVLQQFGLGHKVQHSGIKLWIDVMHGDAKAQKKMEQYNIVDTKKLSPLYKELLPWITNHPNMNLYGDEGVCPNCGSKKHTKEGVARLETGIYQRYNCSACGRWFRGTKRIEGTEYR